MTNKMAFLWRIYSNMQQYESGNPFLTIKVCDLELQLNNHDSNSELERVSTNNIDLDLGHLL